MQETLFNIYGDHQELRDLMAVLKPKILQTGEIKNDSKLFYQVDNRVRKSVGSQNKIGHGCWKRINGVMRCGYFWSKYQMVITMDDNHNISYNLGFAGQKISLDKTTPVD